MEQPISLKENFFKGIIKENPVFVLLLGCCPTLGVTSSAVNGLGMGAATAFVLVMSNLAIALVKNVIPDKVRIPAFIVIIAAFVTVVQLLMAAYTPALNEQLGLFIPLIVVNCIVLGRAEAFASRNTAVASMIDGLGMGVGFTFALLLLGTIRELLGSLSVFGYKLVDADGILIFVLAPGAFITLGFIIATMKWLKNRENIKSH
ncbi:MAG: electron transport complex subunit E [Cytophagales bacterium]|jgi:electron transport complex protein RnfE|nr:electron transport complex subunit E [Cytophagales bacterium]MCA6366014.1 electron transport complex subunit E [Cytophagales bacterium]MCA6373825.1 electron transport complex subunit E [Cytophagales bacterium]MCA6383434.1 electron transport complex subunit E [Cytophagales bacterium]